MRKNSSHNRRRDRDPRPLHLLLAAAELVHECQGLDRGQWYHLGSQQYVRRPGLHIGAIADVIAHAGIDTTRFDGRSIAKRLTRSNIERGLNWPDRIDAPIPFLRKALASVNWTQHVPSEPAEARRARRRTRQQVDTRREQPTTPIMARNTSHNPAVHTRIRPSRPIVRSLSEELAAAPGDVCVVCAAPGIVRNDLPLPMPACDQCWDTMRTGTTDVDHNNFELVEECAP